MQKAHLIFYLHRAAYLFIYQIRYRDAWIVFSEKGHRPKFVKKKWKIKNNDKEELQFQTLRKAPTWRVSEERKKELSTKSQKTVLNWLQFDESKQTTFCSVYDEFPAFVQLN